MEDSDLRVLLIEDDEDDYVLVKGMLSQVVGSRYTIDWVSNFEDAIDEVGRHRHDVYLLDYRLGERNGLELLHQANANTSQAPFILLTGQGGYQIDVEAMKAGASDYLIKAQINADQLERSIRYSIEHKLAQRQLRFLSSKLLSLQEEERTRLAQELHDRIGQTLAAIKFGVENALNATDGSVSPVVVNSLKLVIPMVQNTIEEVRSLYMDLRPTVLDDFGVVAAIGWICREFGKTYPGVQIISEFRIREEEIPGAIKIVIYRVAQEALRNVGKFSKAKSARLSLYKAGKSVALRVEDDGEGFDVTKVLTVQNPAAGVGLASMKERIELSGGTLTIESTRERGTVITSLWPLT